MNFNQQRNPRVTWLYDQIVEAEVPRKKYVEARGQVLDHTAQRSPSQAFGWTTVDRAEAARKQKHRPPTKSNQRILPLKIRHCGVRRHNKIDHPDRPETTEGHHADHYTDDIGSDQRREDEGQRAAYTPRCRPRKYCRSVARSRDRRARADACRQDSTR